MQVKQSVNMYSRQAQ